MTFKPAVLLVFSFASLLSAAPRLVLTSATVGPIQSKPGANGPTQIVEAYNAGSGTLNLSASSSASWLSATVGALTSCTANTAGCYPISINFSTSSLATGTYTEYLTVSDPNAVDSPQQIAVTAFVQGIPSSLSLFVTPAGGSLSQDFVALYPAGSGLAGSVTTQSGGNWLLFEPGIGLVPGPPFAIVGVAQSGQAAGTYSGTVTISGSTASSDNIKIPVTLTVTTSPIIQTPVSTLQLHVGAGAKTNESTTFTSLASGTLNITGATATSPTGNFLSATASGSTVTVAADATSLSSGLYHGTVTIASNAANNSQVSLPVELTVETAGAPLISQGGIINVAAYDAASVSPGDIVALFGDSFAPAGTSLTAGAPPLTTSLGGVQVLVNGVPAPLFYVGTGQINFEMPYEAPAGQVASIQVVNNSVTGNLRSIGVVAGAPRIILLAPAVIAGGYGAIINYTDNSITLPSSNPVPGYSVHAAKAGDTLTLYCIGMGQTTPAAVTGGASNLNPLQTVPEAIVTFGGAFSGAPASATAFYTGLTPGYSGLYQVNVTVPAGTPTGNDVPVSLSVNGVGSNVAYIAISQ